MPNVPLVKDKKTDYWWVDSRRLVIDKEYNQREDYGDIDALVKWIEANGVDKLDPLRCYKKGDTYVVVRGHRRHKAIQRLEKKTGQVIIVPIILEKKGMSVEKRFFEQATQNEGLPFSPWEKAKTLNEMRKYGWDEHKMAEEAGWSLVYVRKLLSLCEAPKKLIDLIREKRVAATYAMEAIAKGEVEEILKKAEKQHVIVPEQELFPAESPARPEKITRSDIRPNSVKIFRKWAPQVDEKELPADKAKIFKFVMRLLSGELEEKDFEKFFR